VPPSATIVGAGPNGLSAAITLAQAGFDVQVREASAVAGGATRSAALTLPGFLHDLGSAVHPLAVASPFFSTLPLREHGLEWVWPSAQVAHPLDDGTAVTLERDVADTASQLGRDAHAYRRIFAPLVAEWDDLCRGALQPIRWPKHPRIMARFGLRGIWSARAVAENNFQGERASALFAGLGAHSILSLESPMSSAIALLLGAAGHAVGWPSPRGGAYKIAGALVKCLEAAGGRVVTGARVSSFEELGEPDRILFDVTPKQMLELGAKRLPPSFRRALSRFKYGPGVFKVDWALREPIPWRAKECLRAGTVHLGGTLDEIAMSERAVWRAELAARPFVLLSQPTLFDSSRAPQGKHTAWAYCHVPNGWQGSALERIEAQIERFAPGFRECVLGRAVSSPAEMQAWNENLVGGDINGGAFSVLQIVFRPTWRLYSTPLRGVYLCSSSTPPGGGVHGMCGYWAAQRALKDWGAGGLRASGAAV
jgi:phytoene dehydrogenase-like protein